ncbi:MAG: hypothetical protein E6K60_05950 [Nitrospirae bacterium]|nr:MAG: hypothetical protein E6K60_05950 [Nitrospirota bacterium]
MTPEEQIAKMTKAITQAIKVLSDPFAATTKDHEKAIQALKESMQKDGAPAAVAPKPAPAAPAVPATPAAT